MIVLVTEHHLDVVLTELVEISQCLYVVLTQCVALLFCDFTAYTSFRSVERVLIVRIAGLTENCRAGIVEFQPGEQHDIYVEATVELVAIAVNLVVTV